MYKTTLEGFPTLGISEKIELPNLAELLQMPFFNKADVEDAYRVGGENLRKIIDSTPLRHDKKYYTLRSQMQFIKPGFQPVNTTDWHVDGQNIPVMQSDDRTHILVGDSSNLYTEFLEYPVVAEEEFDVSMIGFREIMDYFESNQERLGFKPKSIEPNRFYTMTCRHPHRVATPKIAEFRYFFEIRESDHSRPRPIEQSRLMQQIVYPYNHCADNEKIVCLEHSRQWGVIIRDKY